MKCLYTQAMNNRRVATVCFMCCVFYSLPAPTQVSDGSKQAVAVIGEQTIYEDDLLSAAQGQLLPLRNQEYEIKKRALDNLIEQKLLEKAAKEKGVSSEKLV